MSGRILVVDDDQALRSMLAEYLAGVGFEVRECSDGASALSACRRGRIDAVVLDVMMPGMDGFEVCRRLRAISDVPVIMLTARGEDTDRIVGLEIGADDYLPKPFNPRELVARLNAVLRRLRVAAGPREAALHFGRLVIDVGARLVLLDAQPRRLTSHQFAILVALAESAGRVLSREQVLDRVGVGHAAGFDRSIDVHVSRIRHAIEDDPKAPKRLITVRGAGYLFAREQDIANPTAGKQE